MPEILTPVQETQPQKVEERLPQDLVEAGINLKNLEVLSYLDLKDSMFDRSVMDRVQTISDFFQNIDELQRIDFKLGSSNMSKIDKLYQYVLLTKQEQSLDEKRMLLNREKMRLYE